MGDIVFNIAKGRVNELGALGAANDALILVLLKASGLETDAVLKDYVWDTTGEAAGSYLARVTVVGTDGLGTPKWKRVALTPPPVLAS